MIGSVHNRDRKIAVAKQSIEIATNGGVTYKSLSRPDLKIPEAAEILMTSVHAEHKADVDDVWTNIFYGYSWDSNSDKLEISVSGRQAGLQRQVFQCEVLYAV